MVQASSARCSRPVLVLQVVPINVYVPLSFGEESARWGGDAGSLPLLGS